MTERPVGDAELWNLPMGLPFIQRLFPTRRTYSIRAAFVALALGLIIFMGLFRWKWVNAIRTAGVRVWLLMHQAGLRLRNATHCSRPVGESQAGNPVKLIPRYLQRPREGEPDG